jgi:hypothetical protein
MLETKKYFKRKSTLEFQAVNEAENTQIQQSESYIHRG